MLRTEQLDVGDLVRVGPDNLRGPIVLGLVVAVFTTAEEAAEEGADVLLRFADRPQWEGYRWEEITRVAGPAEIIAALHAVEDLIDWSAAEGHCFDSDEWQRALQVYADTLGRDR